MNHSPIGLVAIGASAGGIEAFRQFFERMPPDSGLAFVVMLHSPPGRTSLLPDILARWTEMPVREGRDGSAIEPDRVLVIPPGTIAELRDGYLSLRDIPTGTPRNHTPIDAFFGSVATSLGDDAVGVILSGTGHDGTLGLKAIRARGGISLAQSGDGTRPQYSGMPHSAIAAGLVDFYVPVEDMPGHILAVRRVRQATEGPIDRPAEDEDRLRRVICEILQSRVGHDFSQYKRSTFMRRVQRRMQVIGMTVLQDYVDLLEENREQTALLFDDLLIGVTSFFRDPAMFDLLEKEVIPRLFKDADPTDGVRIWIPGCATGEEVYSLAMLLREHMQTSLSPLNVQIFASDIDEDAIGVARIGRYPTALLEGLSQERRDRFFVWEDDGYTVRKDLRTLCTFAVHSLIRDPPFSRIDLISCRNLLIYLDNVLQDTVISVLHYALVPKGILVLGTAESLARHSTLFAPLDRTQRIFIRRDGPGVMPQGYHFRPAEGKAATVVGGAGPLAGAPGRARATGFAIRRILERFSSPFVVASAAGEIVHFSSQVGRFLEPAVGEPSANLFEMARPGWAGELRTALRHCAETGRAVEQLRAAVSTDGGTIRTIKLVVEPLPGGEPDALYMVVFADADEPAPQGDPALFAAMSSGGKAVADLERENRELLDRMQSLSEEHATAMEELRSSNEELQSVNEELNSSNEELKTSREEIQAINEELNTVNVELSVRVEQLNRSNGDLRNLFDSTNVATIFLDPSLTVRSFTPEIGRIYNLIPSDVGRPLTDISTQLIYTTLRGDMETVLRTLQPIERRLERQDGSSYYLMRILPYRNSDRSADGLLITFVDVTSIVAAELHQKLLVDELNHRVKNMLTVVISLATNTKRRSKSLESFLEVFLGRIHALNGAYALLSRDAWLPVGLRDVLMEELRPFLTDERANVKMIGPVVLLDPRAALSLGLAIHELTTNAVKYGALSVLTGNVDIAWTVEVRDEGVHLVLRWTERGGPAVSEPAARGFGMVLVERAFAHDVGGHAEVVFAPDGVVATLTAPLLTDFSKEKPG